MDQVRAGAANKVSGQPTSAPISVEIWYFYLQDQIDLDNIAKPICDALSKLVYEDDRQIVELHLRKTRLAATFDASTVPALPARAVQNGRDFVYVRLSEWEAVNMSLAIGPFELKEEQAVTAVTERYHERGYEVLIRPPTSILPKILRRFQPGVLARRPGENVFVEVRSRLTLGKEPRLDDIAKAIESMPDWRFELIVANPEVELSVPLDGTPLSKKQILQRLDEAEELDRNGHSEAAILLAWSAGEAALRQTARAYDMKPDGQSARSLATTLYSIGGISKKTFDNLRAALQSRNALAHGFRPRPATAISVGRLSAEIRKLLSECEAVARAGRAAEA